MSGPLMMTFEIERRLTREDDKLNWSAARERIRYEMRTHGISRIEAKVRTRRAFDNEVEDVRDQRMRNERLIAENAWAIDLAKWLDWDPARIEAQIYVVDCGTKPDRRARLSALRLALKLARARQAQGECAA